MKTMFAVAAVLLAACGGGGSDVDAQLTRIDSRPVVDSPPAGCAAELSYGALTLPPENMIAFADRGCQVGPGDPTECANPPAPGWVPTDAETDDVLFGLAQPGTGEGEFGDIIELQLYAGFGEFGPAGTGVVVEGTYQFTGVEAQFATCGLCGLIFADTADDGTGAPDNNLDDMNRNYLATGGTLALTDVPGFMDPLPHTLTATLTDVTFEHVTIDRAGGFQSTIVGDCTSTLTSLTMTGEITEPTGGLTTIRLRPTTASWRTDRKTKY
jgi:hypothetical protein